VRSVQCLNVHVFRENIILVHVVREPIIYHPDTGPGVVAPDTSKGEMGNGEVPGVVKILAQRHDGRVEQVLLPLNGTVERDII
jgi:hypothetical protein